MHTHVSTEVRCRTRVAILPPTHHHFAILYLVFFVPKVLGSTFAMNSFLKYLPVFQSTVYSQRSWDVCMQTWLCCHGCNQLNQRWHLSLIQRQVVRVRIVAAFCCKPAAVADDGSKRVTGILHLYVLYVSTRWHEIKWNFSEEERKNGSNFYFEE
jgi:hypothetical protein